MPDPTAPTVELRVAVDVDEAPLGYDHGDGNLAIEVLLAGGGYLTLLVPTSRARAWAAELDGAVLVAHREATGDPHALEDWVLAELTDPNAYRPATSLTLTGAGDTPAVMRFTIALDIAGAHLDDGRLRAAIVENLLGRFNTVAVAVTNGQPVAGTAT
jgi:hypothetical protein